MCGAIRADASRCISRHPDISHTAPHEVTTRTTPTLDDDVALRPKEIAHSTECSFKEVVNGAIRRGLAPGDRPPGAPEWPPPET